MRALIHGGALLAVALLAACSSKGKVREPAELIDIETPALETDVVWSASIGDTGGYGTDLRMALQRDGLFVASADGHVTAFDPQTGDRLWRARAGGSLLAGPSVSGNAVLVGNRNASVVALSRADGAELWRTQLSSEVQGTPVGDGDVVVVRTVDGYVYGLSAASGRQLWAFNRAMPELVLRGMSPPLLVAGRAVIGMDNGRLVAASLSDGTIQWEQTVSVPEGRSALDRLTDIDGALVDAPGCILAASFGGQVACIDLTSGQAVWRRDVRSHTGLSYDQGKVYVSDQDSVVWGLDSRSGAAAWKQEQLLYRRLGTPTVFDGRVVVADAQGYLHWLDPVDGRIVARSRAGSDPITAPMVAGDGLLYVMNTEGKIRALAIEQP